MRFVLAVLFIFGFFVSVSAQEEVCPGTMPTQMAIGTQGTTRPPTKTNLRAEPSTDADVLTEMPVGTIFTVVDGPYCSSTYTWWKIELLDGTERQGWVAEGNNGEYWIEPFYGVDFEPLTTSSAEECFYAMSPRLTLETARVLGDTQLWASFSVESGQFVSISAEQQVQVSGGPVCSEGYYWYQVSYNGQVGWMIESIGDQYLLDVVRTQTSNYSPSSYSATHQYPGIIGWWKLGNQFVNDGSPSDADVAFLAGGGYWERTDIGIVEGIYYFDDNSNQVYIQVTANRDTGQALSYQLVYIISVYGGIMRVTDQNGNIRGYSGVYPSEYTNVEPSTQIEQQIDPLSLLPMAPPLCVPTSANTSMSWSLIPEVQAREAGFESSQCTSYIDEVYRAIERQCLDETNANGQNWNDMFSENCPGFEIRIYPSVGDIAVYEGYALGSANGHVAYVTSVEADGTFSVSEKNWNNDGQVGTRDNLSVTAGISFIHMVCAVTPIPLVAQGAPSYLVVPKSIYEYEPNPNEFVYYDTQRGEWSGVQFPRVGGDNNATLFFVDGTWEASHQGWTNFWWTYVHICSGPGQ